MIEKARLAHMRVLLASLEREMRRVGWWQTIKPAADKLASIEPFCVDTLTFSEWLQWVYCPKMQELIDKNKHLPLSSGLLPIAEEAWNGANANTEALLEIISRLDNLVNSQPMANTA